MVNVYPLTVSRAVVHSGPRWQHWPHCGHTMWRCPVGRQAAWTVNRLPCPRWPNISATWVRAAALALTSAGANRNKTASAGSSTTAPLDTVIVDTRKTEITLCFSLIYFMIGDSTDVVKQNINMYSFLDSTQCCLWLRISCSVGFLRNED